MLFLERRGNVERFKESTSNDIVQEVLDGEETPMLNKEKENKKILSPKD